MNIEIMNLAKEIFNKLDSMKTVNSQIFKSVYKQLLGKEFNDIGCVTCYPKALKEMKEKYKYILDNNLCPSCKKKEEPKIEEPKIEKPSLLEENIQKEAEVLERRKRKTKKSSK